MSNLLKITIARTINRRKNGKYKQTDAGDYSISLSILFLADSDVFQRIPIFIIVYFYQSYTNTLTFFITHACYTTKIDGFNYTIFILKARIFAIKLTILHSLEIIFGFHWYLKYK